MSVDLSRLLLLCGALAALLYVGADIVAATMLYPGFDITRQQVSELSAIGAPTRPFWVAMGWVDTLLLLGFASGVWIAAQGEPRLRIAAALIFVFAVNAMVGGLVAPMHMRGTVFDGADRMHVRFAAAGLVLILLFMGFGAAALGRGFRIFSGVSAIAMLVAGGIVGTQVSAIAAGGPTPWMGLVERVAVYLPMLWLGVFAVALIRRTRG